MAAKPAPAPAAKTLPAPSGHRPPPKPGYTPQGRGGGKWVYVATKGAKPTVKPKAKAEQPPNYLAPLTASALTKQATKTVTTAYAPALSDLDTQRKQAQGLSDKRTADNKSYQTWLDAQMNGLQAYANAAHAQTQGLIQNLDTEQQNLYQGQSQSLMDQANQRAGNVSNNAQSRPLGSDLQSSQATNRGLLLGADVQAARGVDQAQTALTATRANDVAYVQAGQQKQLSDLQNTLKGIAATRVKLTGQRTGDLQKEIARLQGVEVQKAQSNRDFAAAAEKLQLSAANTASLIGNRAANTKIAQQKLSLDMTKAQLSQMNADRTFKLNQQKFGASVAKEIYQRDHGLGSYRVPGGRGGSGGGGGGSKNVNPATKPLSRSSQNRIVSQVNAVTGRVNQLVAQLMTWGAPRANAESQAWHALHTGRVFEKGSDGKFHWKRIPIVGDTGLLNAGFNLRSGGNGISDGDIAYLVHLGISDPRSWFTAANHVVNGNPGR